jgi:hypothetical protein
MSELSKAFITEHKRAVSEIKFLLTLTDRLSTVQMNSNECLRLGKIEEKYR